MSHDGNDLKISQFTQQLTYQATDLLNIVRNNTNFKIPVSGLPAFLGVTGTITPKGSAGTPVLNQPTSTSNEIRNIEAGNGIVVGLGATDTVTVKHNFQLAGSGAEILLNPATTSPIIRSIVAGAGVTVGVVGNTVKIDATGLGGTNTVIVNDITDFPAAVGGIITLDDNTNYIIAAAITTADRFVVGINNAITANNTFQPLLTYTGTGTMFTGVDVNFSITQLALNCPNGDLFDFSSPTSATGNIISLFAISALNCKRIATVNDLSVFEILRSAFLNATDGVLVSGTTNWSVFSYSTVESTSTSATFIGIDFGTSVHRNINLLNPILRAPAGAIGIKGAAASANLAANQLGVVKDGEFSGGLTPLSVIAISDVRWVFESNAGLQDTEVDGLMGFNGNTAETVISTIDTPVKVNAVWTIETQSKFTLTTDGKATYNGERDISIPVDISLSLQAASGGSINLTFYLALNGTIIANSGIQHPVSSSNPEALSLPWQLVLSKDDFLEVFVENNAGTVNIIVGHSIMRLN